MRDRGRRRDRPARRRLDCRCGTCIWSPSRGVAHGGAGGHAEAARLLRVTGSDENDLPADEHAARAARHSGARRATAPRTCVPRPDLVVDRQQGVARQPRGAGACSRAACRTCRCRKRWPSSSSPAAARWWSPARTARPRRPRCSRWVLEQAGRDPSLMVGGESLDFGGNFKLGGGEFFVIEGDEYDSAFFDKGPKFLHYRPQRGAAHRGRVRPRRHLPRSRRGEGGVPPLASRCCRRRRRWSWRRTFRTRVEVAAEATRRAGEHRSARSAAAEWRLAGLRDDGGRTRVRACATAGGRGRAARSRRPGAINALNALGVYVAGARARPVARRDRRRAWRASRGVARRQEVVGEFGGVTADRRLRASSDRGRRHAGRDALSAIRPPAVGACSSRARTPAAGASSSATTSTRSRAADRVIVGGGLPQGRPTRSPRAELFSPEQLVDDLRRARPRRALPGLERRRSPRWSPARPHRATSWCMMSNGDFGGLRAQARRRPVEVRWRRRAGAGQRLASPGVGPRAAAGRRWPVARKSRFRRCSNALCGSAMKGLA